MNSKERVRLAIQHETPDYVPAYMDCVPEIWEKLMKKYKVDSIEAVQNHFLIDIRTVGVPYIGPELGKRKNAKGETEYQSDFGYWYKKVWNGVEYNVVTTEYPVDSIDTIEGLANFNWPNPDNYNYEAIKYACEKNKGKAIQIGWPGPYQVITYFRNAEKFYMDMALEPDYTKAMLKHYMDFVLEHYERMFIAADGQIDLLKTCDDYGTQCSMLFSVDMWREYFKENTKKLVNLAHKYGAYFMQHSCGAVRPVIPELIKCGVDALDPIQKVIGMEAEGLKRDFGDKLTFHGGIDTQNILPLGTPEQVAKESRYFIETLNKNGGYIFGPSQALEGDVPVENIEAMYETRRVMIG